MELEVFARIVQRWWLAIVAALLIGGAVGYSYADSRTPVYQAGVDLLVGPLSADTNVLRAAGQTAQTYAELASASSTLDTVGANLGDPGASDALVTATASEVTRILRVRVRDDDANFVAAVANGIAAELGRVADAEVQAAQLEGGASDPNVYRVGEIRVLESADPPNNPISPNKQLIVVLGGLAMMVAVAVAVIGYEYMRQAVRVLGDLTRLLPDRVFGRIERSWDPTADKTDRLPVLRNDHSPTATSLRGLSVDLISQLASDSPNGALVFGGVDDDDRSGDVAVNVAAALATTGRRVAMIDANDSTHEVRTWLAPACEPSGEASSIDVSDGATIEFVGRYVAIEPGILDLYATAMTVVPARSELESALVGLADEYDHVVLHTAPAFGSSSAVRWASASAGSVLVVTSDVASARTVDRCALTLSRGADNFIGAVFDERPRVRRRVSLLRRLFGGGRTSVPEGRSSVPTRSAAIGSAAQVAPQGSGQN